MTALYLYAVLDAGHPARMAGLAGVGSAAPPVHVVRGQSLAAAVSWTEGELRPKRRDLNAHQRVVSALWEQGPVLPMRFGTVAGDESAVRADLDAREAHYRERHAALTGKAEYHVRALQEEDAALRQVLAADRSLAERSRRVPELSRDEQMAFGEAVAHRLHAAQSEAGARIHRALAPLAEDVLPGEPTAPTFLACSYLVPSGSDDAFAEALNRATATVGQEVELRVSGPLPPYSFV